MRPASLLNTESLRDWSTMILATFSRSTLLGSAERRKYQGPAPCVPCLLWGNWQETKVQTLLYGAKPHAHSNTKSHSHSHTSCFRDTIISAEWSSQDEDTPSMTEKQWKNKGSTENKKLI